jgi:hypothetical protein
MDTTRCFGRITKLDTRLHMGDGQHWFYLEYRCSNIKEASDTYCEQCSHKYDTCRTQYSRRFMHGTINDEFAPKSRIYGSKWYLEAVKKYGEPEPEYIIAAINAQKNVCESLGISWTKDWLSNISKDDMPAPKKTIRIVRILRPNSDTVITPSPKKMPPKKSAAKTEDASPPKKRPTKKVVSNKIETTPSDKLLMPERFQTLTVSAVETSDTPKEVCEIIHISMKRQIIDDVEYIITSAIDEDDIIYMYSISNEGKPDKLIGPL